MINQVKKVTETMKTVYSRFQNIAAGKFVAAESDIESENYKKYHQEYVEKFIEYDKIRNKVGKYYDLEKYGNNAYWSIDFSTKTITVTINDDAQ